MKAIVQHGYGAPDDVLKLAEVDTPAVGDQEVLVRVRASSANPWDWHFIRGEPVLMRPAGIGGIRKPKFLIPGGDVAGTVEQVGGRVTGLAPGDQVYGFSHGAFAEYVAVSQGNLARKPVNLTFEQAAAVPLGAITAIQGLRAGGLRAGQHVLVIGASGGVGTHVIDYTKQGISNGPARYDLVFQLGGTYSPAAIRKVLTPHGTLIQSYGDGNRWVGPIGNMIKAAVLSLFVGQTLKAFTAKETTETLDEITELIEAGQLTPVIDRTYPLSEAAQAVRLVEQGRPAGKVTITITSDQ
jgi:NADPH:quinone reductase-like Zn-dependent oxidoreductase